MYNIKNDFDLYLIPIYKVEYHSAQNNTKIRNFLVFVIKQNYEYATKQNLFSFCECQNKKCRQQKLEIF